MILQTWLAFIGANIIIPLAPGPTILLVTGDSLANRGRSAWSTAAGVAAGDTTTVAVPPADAGMLLAASTAAFTAFKLIDGSYLVYLGIKSILSAHRLQDDIQAGAFETTISVQQKSTGRHFLSV